LFQKKTVKSNGAANKKSDYDADKQFTLNKTPKQPPSLGFFLFRQNIQHILASALVKFFETLLGTLSPIILE
jgi:hypothetical protein